MRAVVVPLVAAGFVAAFAAVLEIGAFAGGVDVLIDVAGFLAAAADEAVVFEGDEMDGAIDVRFAVLVRGFFSSTELPDLCPALADVPAVAEVAVLRTVDPAAGRAGGLLSPPVAGRVVEDVVGLAADEEDAGTVPGRRAATNGRFGATFSFLTLAAGDAFSVSVSTSDALASGSSDVETSPGVSS